MAGLEEQLSLDVSPALQAVAEIDSALQAVVQGFSTALASALDVLSAPPDTITVPVAGDTSQLTEDEQAAVDAFPEASVDVGGETTPLESDVDTAVAGFPEGEVTVVGETSDAEADLDALAASADIEGSVTIDTSGIAEAEGQMDSFTESAGGAASGAEVTGAAAGAAAGGVDELADAFGVTQTTLLKAAGAIGVVGFGFKEIFSAGLDAVSSQQRVNTVFGEFADELDTINVGDLNTTLEELALSLGSDDEALQQAAASLGFFAQSAGASVEESEKFAEQVIALSARAKALNPALGELDQIANALPRALIRGGAAAAKFGVSLSKEEVDAYAESIGKIPETLSPAERAMVAAELAASKFSTGLAAAVQSGTENAEVRFEAFQERFARIAERLGVPLVEPILSALENLLPVLTSLGDALGATLAPAVDLLAIALGAVAPFMNAFAAGMEFLAPALPFIAGGILAIVAALKLLVTGTLISTPALLTNPWFLMAAAIGAAVTALGFLVNAFKGSGDVVGKEADSIQDAVFGSVDSVESLREAVENWDKTVADHIEDQEALGDETEDITAILKEQGISLDDLVGRLSGTATAYRDTRDEILANVKLTEEELALAERQRDQFGQLTAVEDALAVKKREVRGELDQEREAIKQSIDAQLDQMVLRGALTEEERKAAEQKARNKDGEIDYTAALSNATDEVERNAAAEEAQAEAAATSALTTAQSTQAWRDLGAAVGAVNTINTQEWADRMNLTKDQVDAAVEDMRQTITDFVSSTVGQLPTVADAWEAYTERTGAAFQAHAASGKAVADAQKELADAQKAEAEGLPGAAEQVKSANDKMAEAQRNHAAALEELTTATDPQRLIENLFKQVAAIQNWRANLQFITETAGADVARFAATLGPQAMDTIARGIREQGQPYAENLRSVLSTRTTEGIGAIGDAVALGTPLATLPVEGLAGKVGAAYGGSLDFVSPTQLSLLGAQQTLDADTATQDSAANVAARSTQHFGHRFGVEDQAATGMAATGRKIEETAPTASAETAGTATTDSFGANFDPAGAVAGQNLSASEELARGGLNMGDLLLAAGDGGKAVGAAFAYGLAHGLDNDRRATDAVKLSAAHLMRIAIDAAKFEAGIHSPSAVMAGVGAQMAAGLVQGMAGSEGAVARAGRSLVGSAVGTGTFSTAGGGGISGGTTFNVNVNLASGTPAEAQRAGRLLAESAERTLVRRGVIARVRTGG